MMISAVGQIQPTIYAVKKQKDKNPNLSWNTATSKSLAPVAESQLQQNYGTKHTQTPALWTFKEKSAPLNPHLLINFRSFFFHACAYF